MFLGPLGLVVAPAGHVVTPEVTVGDEAPGLGVARQVRIFVQRVEWIPVNISTNCGIVTTRYLSIESFSL